MLQVRTHELQRRQGLTRPFVPFSSGQNLGKDTEIMKRKRKFLYMLPDAIVGKTDCANYK